MKTFVLLHHGYGWPSPAAEMAWNYWLRRRAASIVDVGGAFGPGRRITEDAIIEWSLSSNPVSGYSIVTAPHLDAAEQLLEGCPIVDGVSVYEAINDNWSNPS